MRTLPLDHQSLFNASLIARSSPADAVPIAHQQVLSDWAATIRSGALHQQKEQQIRRAFVRKIFCDVLGYSTLGSGDAYTLADESYAGKGRVDVVLGRFGTPDDQILVPLEIKGADTPDLDVMVSGRFKSPAQQVWEYATDVPNAKFLLLTNMLEIRLYAVGYTRRVYERFDLLEVAENPAQYCRLQLLLSANNLLGGRTQELLTESGVIEKQLTRELYADYKRWRIQLITALAQTNALEPKVLIAPVQKLLDRLLFVAFSQQRGLLPAGTLKSVHTQTGWERLPLWVQYKALFRAVDKGLPERGVPLYNGGLFAPDAFLDALSVPDSACEVFQEFGKYDFGGEISVNVLGHIFQQSVSDLQALQDLADAGEFALDNLTQFLPKTSASGTHEEHEIVYMPEYITAFVVDQTLGKTLDEKRTACFNSYQLDQTWRATTAEETRYSKNLIEPERVVELLFWRAWLAELSGLKICDPACGSGAFLVAVFDVLRAEYASVNAQIAAITGSMDVFNADKTILNGNLYGVDLSAESIEITKLSLWLKTAQYGKPLESLEAHLHVGNSLITTNFNWNSVFPEVIAKGGFDVIVGNPPYVRMERLKAIKPYLEDHYLVANERADLYCYFFELGLRLLRPEQGRLGFITSSTFFKMGSGENLRTYLLENAQLETVVDFGDLQVFEGATTYPAIVTMRRTTAPAPTELLNYWKIKSDVPIKFKESFVAHAKTLSQSRLTAQMWQFENDAIANLRHKLTSGHLTLKEVYGAPCRGIVTGLNEAFVLSHAQRDVILAKDPHSAELLKPFLEGKDLKKWRVEPQDLWLIYIPKNCIKIDDYPAIKKHLLPFKAALENRATKQEWFELQQAQEAYAPAMSAAKIIYPHFSANPLFSFDTTGHFSNDKSYIVSAQDSHLAALLNSSVGWFLLRELCPSVRGGYHELRVQYVENLPIPAMTESEKAQLATRAKIAQNAAESRFKIIKEFNHYAVRDFAPSGKMPAGWSDALPTFTTFTAELKKRFKRDLILQERNDWDAYLASTQKKINALNHKITQAEREIDEIVYELFGLTEEEEKLLSGMSEPG